MRVLLLDGNSHFRRALADTLTRQGYIVDAFSRASDALTELEHSVHNGDAPDALLFEIKGAHSLLERASVIAPGMAKLIVTGDPNWQRGISLVQAGMIDGYISKEDPDMIDLILSTLRTTVATVSSNGWAARFIDFSVSYLGDAVHLTPQQFLIFAHFLRNPARRIGYEELAKVAGHPDLPDLASARLKIKSTMSNLRAELRDFAGYEVISTVPRKGFQLMPRQENPEVESRTSDDHKLMA